MREDARPTNLFVILMEAQGFMQAWFEPYLPLPQDPDPEPGIEITV